MNILVLGLMIIRCSVLNFLNIWVNRDMETAVYKLHYGSASILGSICQSIMLY